MIQRDLRDPEEDDMKRLARKIAKRARKRHQGRVSMVEVVRVAQERWPRRKNVRPLPGYFQLVGMVMKLVQDDPRLKLVMVSI